MPVKLGFIILSIIGVLRIPEEFYLYKDKVRDVYMHTMFIAGVPSRNKQHPSLGEYYTSNSFVILTNSAFEIYGNVFFFLFTWMTSLFL